MVPSTFAPYTFSRAQQGPQVLPDSSVKVSREVQTSLTWINKTPLRVPKWHPPKKDRERQTFCSWIPLGWRN